MKVIRDISLQLDYEENIEKGTMYARDFAFQSRFIGNFLRRGLLLSKFEPIGFKRLLINGCVNDLYPNKIFESYLCVAIRFEKDRFDDLDKEDPADSLSTCISKEY